MSTRTSVSHIRVGWLLFAGALLAGACSGGATPSPTAAPTASAPAGASVEVTGVDYAFEGVPETVARGTTLTFRNGGNEVHEMVVMRRNDDVDKPFMAIMGEGEDAARTQVAIVGATSAVPGQAGANGVTVAEPGDYALVCFIPVGTVPGASPGGEGGPPHFVQGMLAEFTVTE